MKVSFPRRQESRKRRSAQAETEKAYGFYDWIPACAGMTARHIFFIFIVLFSGYSMAEGEVAEIELSIENHRFIPDVIKVQAGKKIRLTVYNRDKTVEEFESYDLKREKIIPGNSSVRIVLAPLKPGEYSFFGEFHEETAQGRIIVEPQVQETE